MSTGTRLNWLAAIIIGMLLASAHLLDGPRALVAPPAVAAAVHDAIKTAQTVQMAQAVQP